MYTLKSVARRGSLLGAAFTLAIATVLPAVNASADALNPLTERSLTLSSSAPGWSNTDGSGNSTYAPPNSGANGQKSGNYFSFRPSSDATVNTFSFQYCTTSAGECTVPGDNAVNGTDTSSTSDLNTEYGTATPTNLEVPAGSFSTVIDSATGKVKAVPGYTNNNPKYQAQGGTGDPAEAAKAVTGNYIVMYNNAGTWTQSTGWQIASQSVADARGATKNFITLSNATGQHFDIDQQVQVLFFANATHYITNPGSKAFFVKINTYDVTYNGTTVDKDDLQPATDVNVIDGGVTVANVMNQSIQITTKVLETMQFSVGTVDPDTLTKTELGASENIGGNTHTPCDTILTRMSSADPANVLAMGNQTAESSLETAKAYATHSYWRLSSNSSGGATVYYSGHTLSNTSGDEIKPIGVNAKTSAPGSEQFGLAIATSTLSGTAAGTDPGTFNTGNYGVNYAQDRATDKNWENAADNGKLGIDVSTLTDNGAVYTGAASTWSPTDADWTYTNLNKSYHTPRLDPLVPSVNYSGGSGTINTDSLAGLGTNTELQAEPGYDAAKAAFAFDPLSDTIPVPIATESTQVVDCVSAKMRYVANIAATTPAGIYTTKVNYIAAPQY